MIGFSITSINVFDYLKSLRDGAKIPCRIPRFWHLRWATSRAVLLQGQWESLTDGVYLLSTA